MAGDKIQEIIAPKPKNKQAVEHHPDSVVCVDVYAKDTEEKEKQLLQTALGDGHSGGWVRDELDKD